MTSATINQVYDDYLRWRGESAERVNVTFEDYLRDEVC